jgi:NAD(P)-dependent dehydrogenase (short-subunit alcohol dehydrogenase family)
VRSLDGKVAVVTGGAGGIGRAMCRRFAAAGMRVVVADVEAPVLDETVDELTEAGYDAIGVVTDVSDPDSVAALADRAVKEFETVHVLCNNAGVGSGSEGWLWEYELNDWRWAFGVNVWGVVHGINAFVPLMLANGDEGHVVNTSSSNGGLAPFGDTPIYATTKSAVVTITECLYAHLVASGASVRASVLFPGPGWLKTGLWSSQRNRPERWAKERPRRTPYPSLDDLEGLVRASGAPVTEVDEVAETVVQGILDERFWILPPSERSDAVITARAESMLKRSNPAYFRDWRAEASGRERAASRATDAGGQP